MWTALLPVKCLKIELIKGNERLYQELTSCVYNKIKSQSTLGKLIRRLVDDMTRFKITCACGRTNKLLSITLIPTTL